MMQVGPFMIPKRDTKKECLVEKGLQRMTLDFYLPYILIIIVDCCMPIDKMIYF
jgi:hypothetical protein